MREFVSPKQVALALGVSEASLKRWCDKGLLVVQRTAGGHRRIPISGVVSFVRSTGRELFNPRVLGLPPATGRSEGSLERVRELLRSVLETGEYQECRRLILNLYLAGHPLWEVFDKVVAKAFHEIGHRWSLGEVEIYEERRAVEITLRTLVELRSLLPSPPENAPLAIGGTPEGDPYMLATLMAELVLREAGWRAQSYGSNHPLETLRKAIQEVRPRLFWLSVSYLSSPGVLLGGYEDLYRAAEATGTAIVLGGVALTPQIREQLRYAAYCDNFAHLVTFAETLMRTWDGGDGSSSS